MLTEPKIRSFLALAQHLNFTRAAESIFVTQQTLSKQIASMEEDIGTKLFIRDTMHVKMTPAGEELYQSLSRFMKEYEQISAKYAFRSETVLRIACFEDTDLGKYLLRAAEILRQRFPNCNIDIRTDTGFSNILEKIDAGQIEIGLIPKAMTPSKKKYKTKKICREQTYLYVSPDFPGACENMTIADLKDATFFVSEEARSWREILTERCLAEGGFTPHFQGGLTPSTERMMVEGGMGIGAGGKYAKINRNHDLIRISIPGQSADESMLLVWRRGNKEPIVEEYVNCLAGLLD